MHVIVSNEGAVTVLKPIGPLLAGELDDLDNNMRRLTKNWTKRVILNMSEVNFVDSAALELICRYQRQLGERGLKLKLSGLNDTTQTALELTRLARRFEIFADTTAAVRSFL